MARAEGGYRRRYSYPPCIWKLFLEDLKSSTRNVTISVSWVTEDLKKLWIGWISKLLSFWRVTPRKFETLRVLVEIQEVMHVFEAWPPWAGEASDSLVD